MNEHSFADEPVGWNRRAAYICMMPRGWQSEAVYSKKIQAYFHAPQPKPF